MGKAESFADGVLPKTVESNAALRLGPERELFGRSWNEKADNGRQPKREYRLENCKRNANAYDRIPTATEPLPPALADGLDGRGRARDGSRPDDRA